FEKIKQTRHKKTPYQFTQNREASKYNPSSIPPCARQPCFITPIPVAATIGASPNWIPRLQCSARLVSKPTSSSRTPVHMPRKKPVRPCSPDVTPFSPKE